MAKATPVQQKDWSIKNYKLGFVRSVVQLGFNTLVLAAVIAILPNISASSPWAVLAAAILMAVINWAAQPILSLFARIFGILGILALSIFSNAVIMALVFWLLPQIQTTGFWASFWASWLYALIITILNWALVARSQEVFLADIIRRTRVSSKTALDATGFVFMQLDGVSAPVLDWQIKAGNMPNISRLLREEGYVFDTWRTQLPSTTPASQAGILLGSNDNIPAFRWYEKDRGELVVANQFVGAALIEERLSTGQGLLVDGGVSIGNLFSGDAPTNVMVMSKVGGDRESITNVNDYVSFFTTPLGFMRALVLSIGEMVKEVYQARRAITKDIQPRIHRGGSYILLRAVTNVLMRDMQASMVIKNMQEGANSIYVDFLDYDEIAHHAGLARPESLASLTGLDEVVGLLMRAREYAARPYEIVLVSDHGQSQGPTFRQLSNGVGLEDLVLRLIGTDRRQVVGESSGEDESAARSLLAFESAKSGASGKLAKSLEGKYNDSKKKSVQASAKFDLSEKPVIVTGSGNLGNIWLNAFDERATLEEIERDMPELISGLLATKGIGLVIVSSVKAGLVCLSSDGRMELESGEVQGENPIQDYPKGTREDLLRLTSMKTAPDVVVISSYDRDRDEVYAFEELVGNHGGLGGWQTEAVLLHSSKYKVASKHLLHGRIHGADMVHRVLVDWLRQEGQHLNK